MGILTEWLKILPEGFANADKVIEGIVNNVKLKNNTLSENEQNEIIRRRLICAGCPYLSSNAVKSGTYITQRKDEHCTMCGCPISTKTASLSAKCGIEKYNKSHPNSKLELKWIEYKNQENG